VTNQEFVLKLTDFKATLDAYWYVFEYTPSFGDIGVGRTPWNCWFELEDLYTTLIDIFKTRPSIAHLTYERKRVQQTKTIVEEGTFISGEIKNFTTLLRSFTLLQVSENHMELLSFFQYLESCIIGILSLHDPGFLARQNWELRMIVSFPKCGRTWFQFLFSRYMLNIRKTREDIPLTRMTTTHGGALEITRLSPSLSWFPIIRKLVHLNRKTIFLVRDPRDVLVSWYFHTTRREKIIDETMLLSDFLRGEHTGVARLTLFYNIWQYVISRKICPTVQIVRYEDMMTNTFGKMSEALTFWELPIDEAILKQSIEESSFDMMQKVERARGERDTSDVYFELKPGNVNDPDSYKVRRGVVGGYVDYMSKDDIAYVNNYLKDNLDQTLPQFQYI
jgi:hypothetical protein